MFKWRNYDEIHQIKDVINQRNKIDGVINPIEIKNEFIDIRNKLNKRIKKVFPKVKRWPNLSTIMSVPIAIGGLVTGNPVLTVGGASMAGASTMVKELVTYLENKYNWVGFTNRQV